MQRFERWQPVEVLFGGKWVEGRYLAQYLTDRHTALLYFDGDDEVTQHWIDDDQVRPLPRFEATGDEVPLLAGLLAEVEQRMVNRDMSDTNTIGPEAAAVNAMARRCWAAMEATR